MAFISMLFAGVALLVVMFGIILFGIALILDLICIIRACCKKKNHIVLKIFTILFNIGGFALFVLPVGGIFLLGLTGQMQEERRFNNAKYKVEVEESAQFWQGDFTYKDHEMKKIDFLNSPKKDKLTEEGVLIANGTNRYYISSVKNATGYDIYYVERFGNVYCAKDDYEAIRAYYYDPSHLKAEVEMYEDGESTFICNDYDPSKVIEIRGLYETHGNGLCSGTYEELGKRYSISARSDDGLFSEYVSIDEFDGHLVLMWTSGGGGFSGIYLTEELEEYTKNMLYR